MYGNEIGQRSSALTTDQSGSRLLATAIHDLRQPLQTCGLLQGLLAMRAADEQTVSLAASLDDALKSMSAILDALSEASRFDAAISPPRIAHPSPRDEAPCRPPLRAPAMPPERSPHGRTIFVIDDDPALCAAMRELLGEYGWAVETCCSAEAFLEADHQGREGTLLVDARMPGMGGLELLRRLRDQGRALPAIVMTGHGDVTMAVDAMKAGARDFIEKPIKCEDLLDAIERLGETPSPGGTVTAIAGLTTRERQVMDLVLAGHPSKMIAYELGISRRTVECHRSNVMKKAGAKSLAALIRVALAAE